MRFFVLSGMLALVSLGANAAELEVTGAWLRLPPPVSDTAAAYMVLYNPGGKPVRIIGASSDMARSVKMHGLKVEGEVMNMFELETVAVAPHAFFAFSAGGNHLMLVGLKKPLQAGEEVNITLHFADGSHQRLKAIVRDMRGRHGSEQRYR